MSSLLSPHSNYSAMAIAHDRLGWRSFLEGRISKVLVQDMHNHLQNSTTCYTASFWAREFSSRLILITHHQWGYRNAHLHYRGKENKTSQEHTEIMRRTRELTRLDSSTLLPQFRDLLDAEDYDALFEGSTINRQYWLYEVEAALAATAISQARRKRKRSQVSQPPHTPPAPAPQHSHEIMSAPAPSKRRHQQPIPPSQHVSPNPNKRHKQSSITQFFSPSLSSHRPILSSDTPPRITERGLKHKKRRKK